MSQIYLPDASAQDYREVPVTSSARGRAIPWARGRVRLSGQPFVIHGDGAGGIVYAFGLSTGRLDALEEISIGGVACPVGGGSTSGIVFETPKNGDPAQTVSARLVATLGAGYLERHPGLVYAVALLGPDAAVHGGRPECTALARFKTREPRTDTWSYTRNPVRIAADWRTSPDAGRVPVELVDWDSVDDAADWASEVISGEARYLCGLVVAERSRASRHLADLLEQCGVFGVWRNGKWGLRYFAPGGAPVATIDQSYILTQGGDGAGSSEVTRYTEPSDRHATSVQVVYREPKRGLEDAVQIDDHPGVAAGTVLYRPRTIQAPALQSPSSAKRLAADIRAEAEAAGRVDMLCNLRALPLERGDLVETAGVEGLPDREWFVLSAQPSGDHRVRLTLGNTWARSTATASADTKATIVVPRITDTPPSPPYIGVSVKATVVAGAVGYAILVEWVASNSSFVRGYRVHLKVGAEATWRVIQEPARNALECQIPVEHPGVIHYIGVTAVSTVGVESAMATTSVTPGDNTVSISLAGGTVNKLIMPIVDKNTYGYSSSHAGYVAAFGVTLTDTAGRVREVQVYLGDWYSDHGHLLGTIPTWRPSFYIATHRRWTASSAGSAHFIAPISYGLTVTVVAVLDDGSTVLSSVNCVEGSSEIGICAAGMKVGDLIGAMVTAPPAFDSCVAGMVGASPISGQFPWYAVGSTNPRWAYKKVFSGAVQISNPDTTAAVNFPASMTNPIVVVSADLATCAVTNVGSSGFTAVIDRYQHGASMPTHDLVTSTITVYWIAVETLA